MQQVRSIPRPLVRTNQWFIVISVLFTWFLQEPWFLAFPLAAGILGLFFNFNPVMRAAKLFLRKPPTSYIPEDYEQQQFNQIISIVCLSIGLFSYAMGWDVAAYAFTAIVAIAAFFAILGYCIGCSLRFQWIQYRHRRSGRYSREN